MIIGTMLIALIAVRLGGIKPICFSRKWPGVFTSNTSEADKPIWPSEKPI